MIFIKILEELSWIKNVLQQFGAVSVEDGTAKFEVEKFISSNDFGLWRLKMRALLVHQGLDGALKGIGGLPQAMLDQDKKALMEKAHITIILSHGDKVLRKVSKEKIAAGIWSKLEGLYMTKSLVNRLT